ncbi:uncharacterized protein J7T54_006244 [Emericellopsis cladophorae]|uniref:Uncharacterized protein n=1 Tax=Emericellopsis cladophorae TaxID=2686198 RepID=A0A9P9Y9N4_9HYPO|nr:uncharacterized protein J7T54_006244 [Emericellopsis cladophorae]KAI6785905.1 hypothetical protein J7T54_006244 [Emericellopsis cladophorae]
MTAEVSHGRGGAGNINYDDTKYVDGSIVRAGQEGSHGDGAYSAGRGGAGNIGDVGTPTTGHRTDTDLVPEQAQLPPSKIGDHHTGRGGAGNEERVGTPPVEEKKDSPVGLADKLKQKLFKKK